jgi:hypothetical protein
MASITNALASSMMLLSLTFMPCSTSSQLKPSGTAIRLSPLTAIM